MDYKISRDSVLLSTKLKMPAPRKNYVIRRELFAQLNRCSQMQVVYVMGAAGTGKTTLLSSFIQDTGLKNTAWLSLDETNNNLFSFWHYFAAAAGVFFSEDRESVLSLFRSNFEALQMENLLTILINSLNTEEDCYLVLDDMHCIKDSALLQTLEFFLASIPEHFHIFMLSRENPALYLGEIAVSGRLLFIDGDKLRFSPEEGMEFLTHTLKLNAGKEAIAQMNEFAEGWVGGLQLVAAAGGAVKGFLRTAGSSIAADYLTREIFKALSQEERRFLTITGVLSYFDEGLCSALLEGTDFRAMIDRLTEKNLFLICIDEEKQRYRYHKILEEYLKRQFSSLPAEEQTAFRKKSAEVFAARGENEEALYHLFEIEDYEGAMRLLSGMQETVETWAYINRLPIPYLIQDINLCIQCFVYNIANLNSERVHELGKALEERYEGDPIINVLQFVYLFLGESPKASISMITTEQIEELNLGPVSKAALYLENANFYLDKNMYDLAEQSIDRALEAGEKANICVYFYALATKAQIFEEMGRLNESLSVYDRMEGMLTVSNRMVSFGYNHYVGLIGIYFRRLEQQHAQETLEKTKNLLTGCHLSQAVLNAGYDYHVAEQEILFGDLNKGVQLAEAIVKQYMAQIGLLGFDRLLTEMSAMNVLNPLIADRYMEAYKSQKGRECMLSAKLLYARLISVKGSTEEALDIVEKLLTFSRANKNRLRLVEGDLLKLVILTKNNSAPKRTVENLLREAIYYARENRILLPFYIDRAVLLPLLEQYVKIAPQELNTEEQLFLQDIIRHCSGKNTAAQELLSARELEVLAELAKGLTNPEIAESLCISLATVKTHILNIFGKLNVSSRLAAVQGAKRIGILK